MATLTAVVASSGIAVFAAADVATKADWKDPRQVALGKQVYIDHCAACHGANLEGQPNWRERNPDGKLPAPPHDASGHTWHHPDAQLFDITKRGTAALAGAGYQTDMREFGSLLSDAEIWAVLAYIKSTWPPEIRARHDRVNLPHRK
jgi:mono/diheme cytochrome c family protein